MPAPGVLGAPARYSPGMPLSPASTAPALETARLTLRGHTAADFAESAAMWADPAVTEHIGGRPSSAEESWARLLRYAGLWPLLGFGYWVARERTTGRFVGEVGLADFRRDLTPPLDAPEAGWALAPWAHGRGLATEALGAVLAWTDAALGAPALGGAALDPAGGGAGRTVCLIAPENAASVRVAEKCGYREAGRVTYRGAESLVFARTPPAGAGA
jgi:RimJ/RimL family protein N-acetyltransferase